MDATIFQFWRAELARLDLLVHRQILRLRTAYQLALDEFRGLYISDEHVDALVRRSLAAHDEPGGVELALRSQTLREANYAALPAHHPMRRISAVFGLEPFEEDVLLLALAPELDLKYETLLAYLNNDVTRKWPTCDLALRLFSPDPNPDPELRRYLLPNATLFRSGLLRMVTPAPERPAWLASGFTLAPSAALFLLGAAPEQLPLPIGARRSTRRTSWETLPVNGDVRLSLQRMTAALRSDPGLSASPVVVMESRDGKTAQEAAQAVCQDLGIETIVVDVDAVRAGPDAMANACESLRLIVRMAPAAIYLRGGLFDPEGNALPDCPRWLEALAPRIAPLFVACEPGARWREAIPGPGTLRITIGEPDCGVRRDLWARHLADCKITVAQAMLDEVAGRFTLRPQQIRDAVGEVAAAGRTLDGQPDTSTRETLFAAARAQSSHQLGRLAVKVAGKHGWDDLVLPPPTLAQIRELVSAIEHRQLVYERWGFERLLTCGRGLTALFAGSSGTGKTMAAGIIARELGLDLYKVDLSSVVSKYIGETEKNLDRIFRAAHCSNAILFFDEADALFGKRSEVKDAHDRYANIEVAYLLQKLEEHDGVVILATNLGKNIDEAFARRLQYVVQFPLPGEPQRRELWRKMFPPQAPLAADVDFDSLAKQFQLAGGDIRNVALGAAVLAAADGHVITMELITKAMMRQMIKQGKVPQAIDAKQ